MTQQRLPAGSASVTKVFILLERVLTKLEVTAVHSLAYYRAVIVLTPCVGNVSPIFLLDDHCIEKRGLAGAVEHSGDDGLFIVCYFFYFRRDLGPFLFAVHSLPSSVIFSQFRPVPGTRNSGSSKVCYLWIQ